MDALRQRVPVQAPLALPLDRDDDLAVEHARRQQPAEGVHEVDVVAELSEEPVFLTCSAATPQRARRFVATGQRVRPR